MTGGPSPNHSSWGQQLPSALKKEQTTKHWQQQGQFMDSSTLQGSVPVPSASSPQFLRGFAPPKRDKVGTRMCKARKVQECSEGVGEVIAVWWESGTEKFQADQSAGVSRGPMEKHNQTTALSNHCFLRTLKHAVRLSIKELWMSHSLKWLTNVFDYVAKQIFRCWKKPC